MARYIQHETVIWTFKFLKNGRKSIFCVFTGMAALPFEGLSKAAKEDVRERRRGWLAKLPDTTPEQAFLVEITSAWTAMRESVEDSLVFLAATAAGKAADSPEAEELARARKNATTAAAWIKRAGMAASEGTTAAVDIFAPKYMEDELTEEEMKAYKTHKRRSEEVKRSGYPGGAGARRRGGGYFPYPPPMQGHMYNMFGGGAAGVQQQQAAGVGPAAAAGAPSGGQLALQYGGQQGYMGGQMSTFGMSQRSKFPCKACGKMGHWMRDGLCKPDDVAAEMARQYAYLQQQNMSGRVSTFILVFASWNCMEWVRNVVKLERSHSGLNIQYLCLCVYIKNFSYGNYVTYFGDDT